MWGPNHSGLHGWSFREGYLRALEKGKIKKSLRIVFAHAGLTKYEEFVKVANEYTEKGHTVWLETSGLSVPALLYVLKNYDPKKVLYGNDWGFYPLVVSLARMLVATECYPEARKDIFYNNAARMLGLPEV